MKAVGSALVLCLVILASASASEDEQSRFDTAFESAVAEWGRCVGTAMVKVSDTDASIDTLIDITMASCAHRRDDVWTILRQSREPAESADRFLREMEQDMRGTVGHFLLTIRRSPR